MKRIWNQYVFMALVILALFASTVAIAYWAPLWGSVVWALAMFTFGYRLFTLELWNPFAEQLEDIVIVRQFINYAASSWIEIMLVVSMLSMIYLHSNEALIKTIVFTAAHFMGRKIWKWEVETKEEWSKVKKLLRNLLKK